MAPKTSVEKRAHSAPTPASLSPVEIDQPHRVGHLAPEATLGSSQHRLEQAGKDPEVPIAVGVGEGRTLRRDRAGMIEPALMAGHRRLDLAQRARPAQLRKKQRVQMLARGEAARSLVGSMRLDQAIEGGPRDKFQKIVKDAIPVAHGLVLSCPDKSPNSGPESNQRRAPMQAFPVPDCRGLVPAIYAVRRDAIVLKGGGLGRVSYCTKPVDPRVAATWMAGTSPAMTQRASARHK